jgi:hypothetical protein
MTNNLENILKQNYRKKTNKILTYFWIGFIIYTASFAISTTTTVSYIMCQAFQMIGIVIFVPATIKLVKWKFKNQYLEILFGLYCFWQLTIILRGSNFSYVNIKAMLFDAELGLFRFFVPLVLLFPKNLLYYVKILKVIVILGILFLLYDTLFIKNLMDLSYENDAKKFTYEHFVKILSAPSGLILLTFNYQKKKVIYFSIVILIVSALFAIIRARRALLFLTIAPLLFSYMLYLYSQKKNTLSMIIPLLISLFILFFGVKHYSTNKAPEMFNMLSDRATEDTRSGVEFAFYRDMNTVDWIFGKGIDGVYFCPGIETGVRAIYRDMIETDYLNIVLKGGLISLVLLMLILLPAFILGLFYSKNLLSKAAAIWILLWILELYPATVSTFSLHYITIWIATGICYSMAIRNASEKELISIFSS